MRSYVTQMTNRRDVEEYFHDLFGQENARTKEFLKHFFIRWRPPQRQPSPPLVQEMQMEPLVRPPEDELVLFVEKKSNANEKSKLSKVPLFCHMLHNIQFHNCDVCNEKCVRVCLVQCLSVYMYMMAYCIQYIIYSHHAHTCMYSYMHVCTHTYTHTHTHFLLCMYFRMANWAMSSHHPNMSLMWTKLLAL